MPGALRPLACRAYGSYGTGVLCPPPLRLPAPWVERDAHPMQRPLVAGMTPTEQAASREERARANAALIRRMAGGDRDALAELYDSLSRPLYATARYILNDAAEAQDVVHDVFLSLWDNAASFDSGRGAAFSWAVTLTRNRAIMPFRTRANRARLLGSSIPEDLGYELGGGGTSGDERAELGDRASAVRSAITQLPRAAAGPSSWPSSRGSRRRKSPRS